MKLLIDANIILDVLLKRDPFHRQSAAVMRLAERKDTGLFVSATAITDIYYIARRNLRDGEDSRTAARELIRRLLSVVSVAAVSEEEIAGALELDWGDFEDAVQYSVAAVQSMDGVVARNPKDYGKGRLSIWTPEEILAAIG